MEFRWSSTNYDPDHLERLKSIVIKSWYVSHSVFIKYHIIYCISNNEDNWIFKEKYHPNVHRYRHITKNNQGKILKVWISHKLI